MPRNKKRHTGCTDAGHTRDVKVERIGAVTLEKRGNTYSLDYRQDGLTQRQKIDGSLAAARATTHKAGEHLGSTGTSHEPLGIPGFGRWRV